MSSLFNQTNAAPGTAFSGGGGAGSNFPQGINIDGFFLTPYSVAGYGGGLLAGSGNGQYPFNMSALRYIFFSDAAPGNFNQNYLDSSGLTFQGQNTGANRNFLTWNGNGQNVDETFAINNLSTINHQTVPGTISIGALISTLKTAYPGCIN